MIRNSEKTKAKKKALEAHSLAKKIEAERIKNGYVWMSLNRKTRKLVHPKRVSQLEMEGWKLSLKS